MKRLQINRGLLLAFLSFITLLVPLHLAYSMTVYGNMTGYEAFRGYPFDPAFLSTGSFESYSVPVASAYVCPDVGAVPAQPCTVDVDNTWEGARVNLLVAAARANAWTDNGFARALGFAGTAAHGNGWMLVTLRAASAELPPELIANGGKVDVKMTGSAQSTNSADSWHRRVQGVWKLEIGTPGRTQVWSDGTSLNYGEASIAGTMLLSAGGSAASMKDDFGLNSAEAAWCNDFSGTDWNLWQTRGALGSGVASFERRVTITMPIGQTFLVWWHAESLGDAMAVVDPILTVNPEHAQYVRLEVSGIEPPTSAPAPLDGVDIDALAARGYNVELLRSHGLLGTPAPSNTAPVADPGPDQAIVQIGATVQLDGSQSYDPDDDPITYAWTFTSKPTSSGATLNGATSATPSFVADVQGTYTVQLVVSDPSVSSTPETVTASFNNVKPAADAGTGQLATVGDLVTVNGSGSSDANLDPLRYQWSFAAVPPDSVATLSDPGAVQTTFVPDKPGMYGVQLIVNDGFVDSDPSTVQVQVTAVADGDTFTLLRDATSLIASLDPSVFKNSNMQNSLINKLQAVTSAIQSGDYDAAVDKLQNDLTGKADGCAVSGAPDKNDWILTCEAQRAVYTSLMTIVERLR